MLKKALKSMINSNFFWFFFLNRKHSGMNIKNIYMNIKRDKLLENNKFSVKGLNKLPSKRVRNKHSKSPACQWCKSPEIRLVPVSSLANLKVREVTKYQKLWRKQGWPTKLNLCYYCKQNCELAHGGINLWLCPQCHGCLIYCLENKPGKPAYEQLPVVCLWCKWKKKRLTKKQWQKITEQVIKSGLSYQRSNKTVGKSYFSWCSFCEGVIEGQQKNKLVLNRNQLRFWTDKVGEERLICNKCLRSNGEFQRLLLSKYRGRWRVYKSKSLI